MCLVLLLVYDCSAAALVDKMSLMCPSIPYVQKYRENVGRKGNHAEVTLCS